MAESLLSFSEVLLFGRLVDDLRIPSQLHTEPDFQADVATDEALDSFEGTDPIDGESISPGDIVLVRMQKNAKQNGRYEVLGTGGNPWQKQDPMPRGSFVDVDRGSLSGLWEQTAKPAGGRQEFRRPPKRPGNRRGQNRQLEEQLFDEDAGFARIYGFAYEGNYYELPEPVLFLVHGEGESATAGNAPTNPAHAARAPIDPSVSGVAAADYQIADDIRVWPYDKADYTIRMDVATGMFEQVLLDVYFEYDAPMAGAKVSGAKVSGAKVSGAKVSGAKVSGAKVSGAKARGPSD